MYRLTIQYRYTLIRYIFIITQERYHKRRRCLGVGSNDILRSRH